MRTRTKALLKSVLKFRHQSTPPSSKPLAIPWLAHSEFQAHFGVTDKANWFKLKPEHEQFYLDKGCIKTHITCPYGSMVFWDSRTIHCGTNPSKLRESPNFRLVAYVCYKPRDNSNKQLPKQLKKKQTAFTSLRMTTHTPDNVKLFPVNPNCYNPENRTPPITQISPPVLTELGLRLAGF
jgi:ectoine hydroxylase-related dioxygenase (phytanoyl-CoA dioxygenase family)